MPNKGFKHSDKTKLQMSLRHKELGHIPPNALGKKRSLEAKKNYSLSKMGDKNPMKRKEVALKVSIAQKGKIIPKEVRDRISKTHKLIGTKPPITRGSACHLWKGGISDNPYPLDWTETLRKSIRERDKYTCKICLKPQGDKAHHVHHIDYNKNNCDPKNLITLCIDCHIKTNQNREYWINYFKEIYDLSKDI